MIDLYQYAKNGELEVVLCTNNWFSEYEGFTELYNQAADIYSIMNYDKQNNIDSIKEELDIVTKNHKKIETIAHSSMNSEPEESYDQFDELERDHTKILKNYPYEHFRASYHYLPTITYLKKGTVYLAVYFSSLEEIPSKLYLTSNQGKTTEGTFIHLNSESYFLFANVKDNEEYTLSTSDGRMQTIQIKGENGRSKIMADFTFQTQEIKVGDYVLYPYEYDNVEDAWQSKSSLTGWRILNITEDNIQLISAGTPELFQYDQDYTESTKMIQSQLEKYFLSDYALKVESLTKDLIDQYCHCDSENTEKFEQSLIKNNSNTFLLSEQQKMFLLENTGDIYEINPSPKQFGIRPVITISKKNVTNKNDQGIWLITKNKEK